MERFQQFSGFFAWLIPVFIIMALWDVVWKMIGMWKAGRNNDLAWFICIALFNTLGILPIIYLLLKKEKPEEKVDANESVETNN